MPDVQKLVREKYGFEPAGRCALAEVPVSCCGHELYLGQVISGETMPSTFRHAIRPCGFGILYFIFAINVLHALPTESQQVTLFDGKSVASIVYSNADGTPIAKGTEVVIERYEKGIAYVKKWDELMR